MKPSSVATRSSTRGTSCGFTIVTRTSGGGGAVCAGLREQSTNNEPQISVAPTRTIRLIFLLSLLVCRCRAEHDVIQSVFRGIADLACFARRGANGRRKNGDSAADGRTLLFGLNRRRNP